MAQNECMNESCTIIWHSDDSCMCAMAHSAGAAYITSVPWLVLTLILMTHTYAPWLIHTIVPWLIHTLILPAQVVCMEANSSMHNTCRTATDSSISGGRNFLLISITLQHTLQHGRNFLLISTTLQHTLKHGRNFLLLSTSRLRYDSIFWFLEATSLLISRNCVYIRRYRVYTATAGAVYMMYHIGWVYAV